MEQRISFVTLGVRDLAATRRFYVGGLGWVPELDVEGEVVMLRAGPQLILSLWDRAHFEAEVGPLVDTDGRVLGVVFAAAADDQTIGYVLTWDEVSSSAEQARTRTAEVSTRDCG